VVIIKKSNIHGKGVFAENLIPKGTILTCDILEVTPHKLINEYVFNYRPDIKYIHIGFGSFLNSSKNPNLKHIKVDINTKVSYFEVLNDINKDEELFLDYGGYK
jgi:SET domain-containing protein